MSTRDLKGKNSKLIRGALNRTHFREQSESLFLTSGFTYQSAEQAEAIFKGDETGFQYTRYANPTIDTFEKRMAIIDGAESCFATASGMAAVFASLMCQLQAGDHVVSATALFGSCREVIKNVITRYGIEISFIDGKNIESWKKEIKPNTKVFFFETTFSLEDAAKPVEYLLIKLETNPAPAITPADFFKKFRLLLIIFHF